MTSSKDTTSQLIARAASHDKPAEDNDNLADLEELKLASDQQRLQIEILKQKLTEDKDNHDLRTSYTNKIFWLVCTWLGCVIVAVLLVGFELCGFKLSDKVLMTFIATTTLNVLGLFAIVAKWMFQQNNNSTKL